jgi:hypothetical protein
MCSLGDKKHTKLIVSFVRMFAGHLDEQMVASRQVALMANVTLTNNAEGVQLRHPNVRFSPKIPDALLLENEMDKLRERHSHPDASFAPTSTYSTTSTTTTATPTVVDSGQPVAHSADEHRAAKHWAQFSYHRVTASPITDHG